MNHPLLDPPGSRHLLLANEGIVRGALEAGVNVVTCYPGTPSSEVPDAFARLAGCGLFRFEYSVNEKVALEVAAGASLAGALCLVTMKHVGVNVAADPLLTMTTTGLPGGLVLLSADDPGCHSSQNEQDNRMYARFAHLPCFEPASAQEAKDMARAALLLARETQQPVLLRTTTRVSHLRGPVEFGPLPGPAPLVAYRRDPGRFVPVPAVARARHKALAANMEAVARKVEESPFNRVEASSQTPPLGVIASGISRAYLHDALEAGNWRDAVRVFHFGLTWPLPVRLLEDFLRPLSRVLILEEGEPLLETAVRALAQERGIPAGVSGKGGVLTRFGEYSTPLVGEALASFLDRESAPLPFSRARPDLPQRPPNLCAGCSHRSAFYAVRAVYGDSAVYSSDIGCYTLGLLPPLDAADFLFCMGSSLSAGSGFAAVSDRPVVAFIGDSTFFHSGLTGLANAVFNRHNLLAVILDNGTTAMTGHQPNPGMDQKILGPGRVHLDIEAAVRGCGVSLVRKARALNQKAVQALVREMKEERGVRVLILEEPCVLFARRSLARARRRTVRVAIQDESARACFDSFACPAFRLSDGRMDVDPELCTGCMVCPQISPSFTVRAEGA
ncbi:MAG: indolepyruvate ferredoxin oxidoreductase subunit alpha [Desulfovibrio sp.]|jgi:indolepyruvate ferredoxin oxidoreductase alpha subunit|nr:indolepyruvate ferredoxin oxidoreductase subunit alpha [Desulfovibrio sp.]